MRASTPFLLLLLCVVHGVGQQICHVCSGDSPLNGAYCNNDKVCTGTSCSITIQLSGVWTANCSSTPVDAAKPCTVDIANMMASCQCGQALCNSPMEILKTIQGFLPASFKNFTPNMPNAPIPCFECGNVYSPGASALSVSCNEASLCWGSYCVTKRGENPHSYCGTSWDGSGNEGCFSTPNNDEVCVCKQPMCNVPYAKSSGAVLPVIKPGTPLPVFGATVIPGISVIPPGMTTMKPGLPPELPLSSMKPAIGISEPSTMKLPPASAMPVIIAPPGMATTPISTVVSSPAVSTMKPGLPEIVMSTIGSGPLSEGGLLTPRPATVIPGNLMSMAPTLKPESSTPKSPSGVVPIIAPPGMATMSISEGSPPTVIPAGLNSMKPDVIMATMRPPTVIPGSIGLSTMKPPSEVGLPATVIPGLATVKPPSLLPNLMTLKADIFTLIPGSAPLPTVIPSGILPEGQSLKPATVIPGILGGVSMPGPIGLPSTKPVVEGGLPPLATVIPGLASMRPASLASNIMTSLRPAMIPTVISGLGTVKSGTVFPSLPIGMNRGSSLKPMTTTESIYEYYDYEYTDFPVLPKATSGKPNVLPMTTTRPMTTTTAMGMMRSTMSLMGGTVGRPATTLRVASMPMGLTPATARPMTTTTAPSPIGTSRSPTVMATVRGPMAMGTTARHGTTPPTSLAQRLKDILVGQLGSKNGTISPSVKVP
ncbi:hypothetical protein QR680_011846 [Steinernema hermaphroditum]|uniref:DUF7741 domain-containing protein n=1 Tax=Steinernema hermaphroditum TaxID=289476 RepID=A0AA39I2F3_9BILA|nr:hypothetical protein QR680_011846 [Steinernema hermaphroditum]